MSFQLQNLTPPPSLQISINNTVSQTSSRKPRPMTQGQRIFTLKSTPKSTHANKKLAICKGKNKKGEPCSYRAAHTVYCTRHISQALASVMKLQKWWRYIRVRKELLRRGKAYERRDICTNLEDFFTFTEVEGIPDKYFVSYHETQSSKVWGFDVRSLNSLFQSRSMENPYTRMPFDETFVNSANYYIRKYHKDPDFVIKDEEYAVLSEEEQAKKDCIGCFVDIGCLGYTVDHTWLCNLTRAKLIKLYYEFQDTIMYRSYLNRQQVQEMFGHHFPFSELVNGIDSKSYVELLGVICSKLKMILRTNSENKDLGILLFLTALTNVSPEAMSSLYYLSQNF